LNAILLVLLTASLLFHAELPLMIFKSFEHKYKKEIKQLIKAGVPEKDLVRFKFHISIIKNVTHDFSWVKKNEFRYKNEMYDIVKTEFNGDSVYYKCIHDFKESNLFSDFDKYLIDLLKSDSGKKNEFLSLFNYLNIFYLLVQPFSINDKPVINSERILAVHSELSEGFFNILTPPPEA
jgi:hypothetical protein